MIILASTSPRRIEIFNRLGLSFKVVPHLFDESSIAGIAPYYLPVVLAREKAKSIAGQNRGCTVIGFDTIVIHNNKILGKPKDIYEAKAFLTQLSGEYHDVVSGTSIISYENKIDCSFFDISKVKFKTLSSETISEYMKKVNTLDKAGAYAIQEYGEMIIERTEGSIDNIIGIPTEKLIKHLKAYKITS
ncbi:MAG TPA: septum formation protein Maf [Lentisphaeria bacterium]|nr:septum formation protein Maf [Lentisphaeria bacterium]